MSITKLKDGLKITFADALAKAGTTLTFNAAGVGLCECNATTPEHYFPGTDVNIAGDTINCATYVKDDETKQWLFNGAIYLKENGDDAGLLELDHIEIGEKDAADAPDLVVTQQKGSNHFIFALRSSSRVNESEVPKTPPEESPPAKAKTYHVGDGFGGYFGFIYQDRTSQHDFGPGDELIVHHVETGQSLVLNIDHPESGSFRIVQTDINGFAHFLFDMKRRNGQTAFAGKLNILVAPPPYKQNAFYVDSVELISFNEQSKTDLKHDITVQTDFDQRGPVEVYGTLIRIEKDMLGEKPWYTVQSGGKWSLVTGKRIQLPEQIKV
ncbi:hypothetical protein AA671_25095 [Delftia tsuruhatensis]|uniref:hypothetical protein n=1 Tax=Delftia tsuruhatensis TaxID=180282 RepID=UPI0006426C3B|nr:hypothetical protein [Delftia tsuruhatensis]KLO56806.1 hypothetical protein AA671_25095 [Delftia tsuruhatensis]